MSFLIEVDLKSLAGANLIEQTVREIQDAYRLEKKATKLTQQGLAKRLGLKHRSVVNRWLLGKENLSLKTIGELAWALNKTARITLENNEGENYFEPGPKVVEPAKTVSIGKHNKAIGSWHSLKPTLKTATPVVEHA